MTELKLILERIDVSNLPGPLQGMMHARLAPFEGQLLTNDLMRQIESAAVEVDRHIGVLWRYNRETKSASLTIALSDRMPTPAPQADFPSSGEMRVRVGGGVQAQKLIEQKAPEYPPLAKEARIQGTVRFNALINKEGRLTDVQLVSGHPLLAPAALAAVKEWVYQPTMLSGKPVEVITQVDVNFTLP